MTNIASNSKIDSLSGQDLDWEAAIVRQPLTIESTALVGEALALMSASSAACSLACEIDTEKKLIYAQAKSGCVLVMAGEQLIGIVTERNLVRLSATEQHLSDLAITDVMVSKPVTLQQSEFKNLLVPLDLFQKHHIRQLPLLNDQGKVVGLITQDSLRQSLRPIDMLHLRLAADVMTKQVVNAPPTASIIDLIYLMTEHNISSVVIVDTNQPLMPIGIVTERDIVQFLALEIDFVTTTAQAVMSTPVFSVLASTSLWSVRMLMQQHQINRVVVTDAQGYWQGIVTQSSLLNVFNPMEIYQMMEILQQKVCRLESEQLALLANRNTELELQVQKRTQELEQRVVERTSALANSQRFIERIAEASPDILYLYDVKQHRNLYCNRNIAQSLGYTTAEIEAMGTDTFKHLLHPEDFQRMQTQEELLNAAPDGTVLEFEHRMQHANGQWRWLNSRDAVFSRDATGYVEQIIGTAEDISERKEYEQKLEQSNVELLRATRLKDEFLANMSHELRTPLNAILGMSEILEEEVHGSLNDKQRKSVKMIDKSGRHLLDLINDILELSKIEAGKLELSPSKVRIKQLCQASLNFVRQQAMQKSIGLITNIPEELQAITVDERRIRQVLINLLNNAVKFTPQGGQITLNVQVGEPGATQYLYISIQDTGIGIAADDLHKLFKSFSQIDSNLNRQYEGTGLGLALVKQIVELHGGSVTVQSALGKGSCFMIKLPYSQVLPFQSIIPDPTPIAPETSAPIELSATPAPLILLAEDNEANVSIISNYLEAKGLHILVAQNGQTAIDLTYSQQPDLILMDIQMPGVDGLEAIQILRRDVQFNALPIIALTALAMPGDREKFLAAGANGYLAKPVRLKELLTTIWNFLPTEKER